MSPAGADERQLSWAMSQMLEDQATPAQIASLVTALRIHGESAAQVRALLEVMLEHAVLIDQRTRPDVVVDIVGTGGDGADTVNISTMAALVVAAVGAPVIKHGNRAASSAAGSADVLEAAGVRIDAPGALVSRSASDVGIGFCFAPAFHPALRFVGPTRRELKVPTVFNILGPLANPAQPEAMLVGCSRLESAPTMAEVLNERGVRALVVRGEDGLDEISLCAPTHVWDATGETIHETTIDPLEWGIARVDVELLRGTSPEGNAQALASVLDPARREELSPERLAAITDSVVVNAAAALVAYDAACGEPAEAMLAERIAAALPRARTAIESGAAWDVLTRWVEFGRAYAD